MRVRVYGNLAIYEDIIVPSGEGIEEAVLNKIMNNITVRYKKYKFKKQRKRQIESEKQLLFIKIKEN